MGWASMAKPDPKSTTNWSSSSPSRRSSSLPPRPNATSATGSASRWAAEVPSPIRWWMTSLAGQEGDCQPGGGLCAERGNAWVRPPGIQAGAILGLGDDAAKVRGLLEKYAAMIPPGRLETIKIGGEPFYRLKPDAESPVDRQMGVHAWDSLRGRHRRRRGRGLSTHGRKAARVARRRPQAAGRRAPGHGRVRQPAEGPARSPSRRRGGRAGRPIIAAPIIAALDLENYVSYAAVSGLDKEGYVSRFAPGDQKPGGIFLGGKPLEAKDLAAIPADATWAGVAKFDPDRLWLSIVARAGKASPPAGQELAQAVDSVEKRSSSSSARTCCSRSGARGRSTTRPARAASSSPA